MKRTRVYALTKYRANPMVRIVGYVLLITIVCLLIAAKGFQARHADDAPILGVSFSTKYARELQLDPQRTLLSMLDEVNIKHFRLMSYWDEIEASPDQYDFSELDWQIDQVGRHEGTVSLAIGQRQPRWPECHIPRWASELDEDAYQEALLGFIKKVVVRYRDSPTITSYQLENEAANRHFGECPPFNEALLKREYDLVKQIDNNTPVTINASNQSGTPLFGQVGDRVGFSIYKKAGFRLFGKWIPWSFWYVPSEWHSLRALIVEISSGAEPFIHELQAEPWGPEATVNLSIDEQNKTMNATLLKNNVEFAQATGMKEIYLWGGEWWYWRKTVHNDSSLWDAAKIIYAIE